MELTPRRLWYLTEGVTLMAVKDYRSLPMLEAQAAFNAHERVVKNLVAAFPESLTLEEFLQDPDWLVEPAREECFFLLQSNTKDPILKSLTYEEFTQLATPDIIALGAVRLLPIALELLALIPRLPMIELVDDWDEKAVDEEIKKLLE